MNNENTEQCKERWSKAFAPLIGTRITNIRYLSPEEQNELDWHESAIVIQLSDGTQLFPSRDDEGNGAGALFVCPSSRTKVPETAPVIR